MCCTSCCHRSGARPAESCRRDHESASPHSGESTSLRRPNRKPVTIVKSPPLQSQVVRRVGDDRPQRRAFLRPAAVVGSTWLLHASVSSLATTGETAARSRMEPSVNRGSMLPLLVHTGSAEPDRRVCRPPRNAPPKLGADHQPVVVKATVVAHRTPVPGATSARRAATRPGRALVMLTCSPQDPGR